MICIIKVFCYSRSIELKKLVFMSIFNNIVYYITGKFVTIKKMFDKYLNYSYIVFYNFILESKTKIIYIERE